MGALIHVVYSSECTRDFPEPELRRLLEGARKANASLDITGILLFEHRSFFQVLEGSPVGVTSLYERLERDPRHRRVVKLIEEPIERRDFREWSMGLARVTSKELAKVPGLSDFFTSGRTLDHLEPGNARKLLSAFRDGRWRASVA